jgi:hypothetical protein
MATIWDPEVEIQSRLNGKDKAAALRNLVAFLKSTGVPEPDSYVDARFDMPQQFEIELVDFRFDNNKAAYTPLVLDEKVIENTSEKSTLTEQFSYSKTTTDSLALSFTEGLKAGVSAKFKAGIPVANTEWTISGEISFSSTQSDTITSSHTWSHTVTVQVPPQSRVRVKAFVTTANVSMTFSAAALVESGYMFTTAHKVVNGQDRQWHDFPMVPIRSLLPDEQDRSLPLSGTYHGTFGISSYTTVEDIK